MINTILLVACQLVVGYAFCVCLKWVSDHQVAKRRVLPTLQYQELFIFKGVPH